MYFTGYFTYLSMDLFIHGLYFHSLSFHHIFIFSTCYILDYQNLGYKLLEERDETSLFLFNMLCILTVYRGTCSQMLGIRRGDDTFFQGRSTYAILFCSSEVTERKV